MMDDRIRYFPEDRRRSTRTGRFVRSAFDDMDERYDDRYDSRYEAEDAYDDMDERPMPRPSGRYRSRNAYESMRGPRMGAIGFAGNMGFGEGSGDMPEHLSKSTAKRWVKSMDPPAHWSMEQTTQVMQRMGADCNENDFYAAMNLMYSDYRTVAQEIGQDNPDFYAKLAKAFLCDEDAVEGKIVKYYGVIVEH